MSHKLTPEMLDELSVVCPECGEGPFSVLLTHLRSRHPDLYEIARSWRRCEVDGCDEKRITGTAWCKFHTRRAEITGDPLKRARVRRGEAKQRDSEGNKLCYTCKSWLPEANFTTSGKTCDGLSAHCAPCERASSRRRQREKRALVSNPAHARSLGRDDLGRKRCSACKGWKAEENFSLKATSADGLCSRCRDCDYISGKRSLLKKKYGLTLEQYDAMYQRQGGECALCSRDISLRSNVDHDHSCCPGEISCGKCVRALLCVGCNCGIGLVGDDPVALRRAADYVEAARMGRGLADV